MTHTQDWQAAIVCSGGRGLRLLALVAGVGAMAACSSTPDAATPVESTYNTGSSSGFPQPERPAGTAPTPPPAAASSTSASSTAASAPPTYAEAGSVPGADQPYPNLATVPERPTTRTAAERAELEAGLVADRTQRHYSDEVISLQGSSDTELASAPPPPPDLPPSPYESPSPPSAAAMSSAAAEVAPPSSGTSAPPPLETAYTSAASGGTAASSMEGGSVDSPPPPPATGSEAYLPPPPSREAAATAAEADAPAAYTPSYAQPEPTYSSAPSTGGPVPVTGPGAAAAAPAAAAASAPPAAAASTPGAASSSVTTGVESVYQAMLREQSQSPSTLPPVERPSPPPVYAAPAAVAGAQGRSMGRGPGGERLVSYQPTTMTPASAPSSLPVGFAQQAATIQFNSGSSSLDARDRSVLRDLAQLWRQRGGRLYVVGHASGTGSGNALEAAQINERISQRRAESVASALARYGVPRTALVVSAVGASQPQYAEVRATGIAGNQRVEIYFVN